MTEQFQSSEPSYDPWPEYYRLMAIALENKARTEARPASEQKPA